MSFKKVFICLALFIMMTVAAGCATEVAEQEKEKDAEQEREKEKVTVTLDWTPNTNHTGLYVAMDKGYFAEEGLEVEVVQLSGGNVEQVVGTGKSEFGFTYQEAVTFARLQDIPVVSIAAVIQHNTSGFASLQEKGIESPADFEGMRYGGWGSPIEETTIKYLMDQYDADYEKVEILTTGVVDFFAVSEKDADFSWIFYGWDGIAAEIKGIDINYIDLREEDPVFDYYTPVIVAGEDLIDNDPELTERFMKALTRGYLLAMEDPMAAAEILLEHAPELDRDLVVASQEWLQDKYRADAEVWGWQDTDVWADYAEWLYEQDLTEAPLHVPSAFTNEYLYYNEE